jgi:hypothetical protein
MKIMIGLWGYAENAAEAAQSISRGEESHVVTRLSEAVAAVRTMLNADNSAPESFSAAASSASVSDQTAA